MNAPQNGTAQHDTARQAGSPREVPTGPDDRPRFHPAGLRAVAAALAAIDKASAA